MPNETWKKWLSYLVPQTKYIESAVSGRLEVGWRDGKKVLDNGRVNYSYGGLQKVLNYGLEQIPLDAMRSVLVLGMGGGSVIESLRTKFKYTHPIVAVEIDPVVIEIAEEEFGITAYSDLEVVCVDAAQFLEESKQNFDLIIVDLFIGEHVPERFYGKDFWQDLEKRTNKGGKVLFNAEVRLTNVVRDMFLKNLPKTFSYDILTDVMGGNTLVILDKKV